MVGEEGLEPSASASRTLRATKLRYSPVGAIVAFGAGRVQCVRGTGPPEENVCRLYG